jgi:autotransporter-associated beta strand protein
VGSDSLIKQGSGTLVLSAANLHTGGTIVEEGTLVLRNISALGQGGVQVRAGAKLVLDGGGGRFTVPSLTLDPAGRIDVGMSQLSIRSGFSRDALLAAIDAAKGDDGMWAGTSGIGSSVVQGMVAEGTNRTLGWLGWVDNGDSSFTVGFAAAGDTNLDGCVDMTDIGNILQQAEGDSSTPAAWNAGDFNHDEVVDPLDIAELIAVGQPLLDAGSYLPAPPPATPENLRAMSVSTASIMLSWSTTDAPAGYEIERSVDGVRDWRPVAPEATQINGTSATISGLKPGERAFFRLRSFGDRPSWWWDDRYRSADTAAVAATAVPSAPVNVTARGVTPHASVITWERGPGRSTGIVVQRQTEGESAWVPVGTVTDGRRFLIDQSNFFGQAYSYRVQAVSDALFSEAVSPSTPVIPPTVNSDINADYDSDGVPDAVEVVAGSNPDASDSDGDGIDDYREIQQGTDPLATVDDGPLTSPPSLDEWCNYFGLRPGQLHRTTGVAMLPANVSLPARIVLHSQGVGDVNVNGTRVSVGRSGYDGTAINESHVQITVSTRWLTIDLSNPSPDANLIVAATLDTPIWATSSPIERGPPLIVGGDGLDDIGYFLSSMEPSQVGSMEAWRIGQAIVNTWTNNADAWWHAIDKARGAQKEYGYFCHEWAYAFKKAADNENRSGLFRIEVEQAIIPNDPQEQVHYWVKISSDRSPIVIYVDDGFKNGRCVHSEPPIPDEYEYHPGLWVKPGDGRCFPPKAYTMEGTPVDD